MSITTSGSPARPRGRAPSAVGSSARTSASPTSTASNPTAPSRRGVGGRADRRLRDRDHRRPGYATRADSPTPRSSANVARSRLFTPTIARARRAAPARSRARRAPRRARRARARRASACRSASSASSGSAAHDEQDRVGADRARLVDLHLVDREVLAQHRQRRSPRARPCRSSTAPPKYGASVSTDSAAAPPASYALAVGRGIEVGREVALRRRPALQLADHRDAGRRRGAARRRSRAPAARRARAPRRRSRVCGRRSSVTSSRLRGEDLVEDGHSDGASVRAGLRASDVAPHDRDLPERLPLGRRRRPRTRSRAATGTTTGGRSSTSPTRRASSRRATAATATTATPRTSRSCATSASASYRFSIEWSRIEPEDGEFSRAALDYYRRVLAECHEHGVAARRHVPSLLDPALDGRARRLGRARDRRPLRPLLRAARSRTSATSSRSAARSTSRTSCRCSAT